MSTPFLTGFTHEMTKLALMASPCHDEGPLWSDRFKGTPMHEDALNLEVQEAQAMLQLEERRIAERAQQDQQSEAWRQEAQTRDQFHLQRKRLELALLQLKQQTGAEEKAEGWQDLDATRAPKGPGAPAAAAPGAPPPRPGM